MQSIHINTFIIGGGATGLWLLDQLRQAGKSALLAEAYKLGSGQTIASQGILHSGLKYSLQGLLTPSARQAREMPKFWRSCLEGSSQPDLSETEVSANSFYLWGTNSASSKLGMLGARLGLQVTPRAVSPHNAPALLKGCPGAIFRVDEQVIRCQSLLGNLAERNTTAIVKMAPEQGVKFSRDSSGKVSTIELTSPEGSQLQVTADWVVLAAGRGNANLRQQAELKSPRQQIRPLHMVMLRGPLPHFFGHCVDGATTRVSITSAVASNGDIVWQIGGKVAEEGVHQSKEELIAKARRELLETMPGIQLDGVRWSTYRVDRAEGTTMTGARPESYRIEREANLLTAWPTKLVLVPLLVDDLMKTIGTSDHKANFTDPMELEGWNCPEVAQPPWEVESEWTSLPQPTLHVA